MIYLAAGLDVLQPRLLISRASRSLWLLPHAITSFLGNGVLTGLLYNAKPQWDKNILPLFFFRRFYFLSCFIVSVLVSGFAPRLERGPGFMDKIRCPGVSIGL